jgi:hypothetical protein
VLPAPRSGRNQALQRALVLGAGRVVPPPQLAAALAQLCLGAAPRKACAPVEHSPRQAHFCLQGEAAQIAVGAALEPAYRGLSQPEVRLAAPAALLGRAWCNAPFGHSALRNRKQTSPYKLVVRCLKFVDI